MALKWKLLLAILPGIILMILIYTVGVPRPQTRPTITALVYVYIAYGFLFAVYNQLKKK